MVTLGIVRNDLGCNPYNKNIIVLCSRVHIFHLCLSSRPSRTQNTNATAAAIPPTLFNAKKSEGSLANARYPQSQEEYHLKMMATEFGPARTDS